MATMQPQFENTKFPLELRERLRAFNAQQRFSRRYLLAMDAAGDRWRLLNCVFMPLDSVEEEPSPKLFEYPRAVLGEDSVTSAECEAFIEALGRGTVELAGRLFEIELNASAEIHRLPIENDWMLRAGTAYVLNQQHRPQPLSERLLAVKGPYFPDVYEAARRWLGLRVHHASSDARTGAVAVLLPETRAFIADASLSAEGKLTVRLGGDIGQGGNTTVKGAYWHGPTMQQLHCVAETGVAEFEVPSDADRLELFVVGPDGKVFDYHTESTGYLAQTRSLLDGVRSRAPLSKLHDAIATGECAQVEFKQFVDLPKHRKPLPDKDKLMQVLRTVSAFANAQGGTLFIGVSDDGQVVGVNESVAAWCEVERADSEALQKYVGALKSRLREDIYPVVELTASISHLGDRAIVLLDVSPSPRPVSLKQDNRMFVRRAGSNMSVAPADWSRQGDVFPK